MNRIDLHIHSYYSDDGEFSPREILDMSRNQGMRTISITDHNSTKGIEEALQYGLEFNIVFA